MEKNLCFLRLWDSFFRGCPPFWDSRQWREIPRSPIQCWSRWGKTQMTTGLQITHKRIYIQYTILRHRCLFQNAPTNWHSKGSSHTNPLLESTNDMSKAPTDHIENRVLHILRLQRTLCLATSYYQCLHPKGCNMLMLPTHLANITH